MPEPLRVAFIGAGANTRLRHLPGLAAIEGVELVAVCNRSLESGHRVADQFGIDRVTDNPADIFGAADIDAVCIGTWPYRHREFVVAALEAGKHVLCEARMAMDATEAREMLEAARAQPGLVAQLVPAPFDFKSWRTIRRLVGDGTLGEIREVHASLLNGNSLNSAPLHWREQHRYSGTNTMFLGILAEMVRRWLGPTEDVVADAATYITERVDESTGQPVAIDIPDSLGVLARMTNGARATYRLSTVLRSPMDASGVAVYGTQGTLHWYQGDTMRLGVGGGEPAPLEPDAGTAGAWTVEADFVASIREGRTVELTSFEDGVAYMQFTEAVWRAWHEGRRVRLDEV
ncbi:MAG: Gfo/Idh/MocA family oxidoreductase [Dehalococcoidia bacterium]|nr:Gfo/Idh/MocA family oxidoreductase [Dehalococcoidia bacterium]